jgi:hypothetical protein
LSLQLWALHTEVKERQAKAAQKVKQSEVNTSLQVLNEFAHAAEVKMAVGHRALVEDAIKKVCLYSVSNFCRALVALRLESY